MNKSDHPFKPSLIPVFSGRAMEDAVRSPPDVRRLFHRLVQAEDHGISAVAYLFLRCALDESASLLQGEWRAGADSEAVLSRLAAESEDWARKLAFSSLKDNPAAVKAEAERREAFAVTGLIQAAPVISTESCWLREVSQAAAFETEIAARTMSVYLALAREARGDPNAAVLYRAALAESGLEPPAFHTLAFAESAETADSSFELGAVQLALSLFPRAFFPEILGFTLAFIEAAPLLECVLPGEKLRASGAAARFFSARKERLASQKQPLLRTAERYIALFAGSGAGLPRRIAGGSLLYRRLFERFLLEARLRSLNPPSLEKRLADALGSKAAAAFGHHAKIRLGDRSLDQWFSKSPFDGEKFLSALRQSPYVDATNPAASPLLKLFDFGGPMFGVLDPAERELLDSWLAGGEAESGSLPHRPASAPERGKFQAVRLAKPAVKPCDVDYDRLSNRQLYFYLVNADLYPEVAAAAKSRALRVLREASWFCRPPFERYRHEAFDDYLDKIYRREIEAYRPLQGKPRLTREDYAWGIGQLAPAILTDGCWLQRAGRLASYPDREVGGILFRIFRDEIGAGVSERSHPVVYRRLLESLGIHLPPVHTREFAERQGFLDSAFDIPVYLLSISRFTSSLLPELLGLNLAIELSGLGKVYLRLVDELKYWDIDPTIVRLHVSIDNFASGHSAMAKKAIQLYLDGVLAECGEEEMQRHWRRIHNGYRSLNAAGRRFKFALVLCFFAARAKSFFLPSGTDGRLQV
ncbi:MAG: iron-containing redox enzyme family protein [Gammaproteobacteria bacterium]